MRALTAPCLLLSLMIGSAMAAPLPKFGAKRESAPSVAEGNDGVLYGLSESSSANARPKAEDAWTTSTTDTQLKSGWQVRTNSTRTARLLLRGKKDDLRLPEETQLTLESLSGDGDEVVIALERGSVWSEVEPRTKADAFRVRTPELTAGVRGTNFRVDRAGGVSKVSVISGSVHVTATKTGAFVTLKKDQVAVVNADGQIMDLLAAPKDEQRIWDTWDQWAQDTTIQTGSVGGMVIVGSLAGQVAVDNAAWEAEMQDYMRNTAANKYAQKLDEYAAAFVKFANDTDHVAEDAEGWSLLKFDTGLPGWAGPYVDGPIPPLDPWRRPLKYVKVVGRTGNLAARVYSFGEDRRDNGGTNADRDIVALKAYGRRADGTKLNP